MFSQTRIDSIEETRSNAKQSPSQRTIINVFASTKKYRDFEPRAKEITNMIAKFIIKGLRAYSIVDSTEFRDLVTCLDPRYRMPSRKQFSEVIIPKMYEDISSHLEKAEQVSLTTDGWTSYATDNYTTITSTHITEDWKLENYVLQTRPLNSQTGEAVAGVLTDAVDEWKLPTTPLPTVVTDNAASMIKAVNLFGSSHVPCLAHTLNLAVHKSLKVKRTSNVIAQIRRIVAFFHRSPMATSILTQKAVLLNLPSRKLKIDVQTRWNCAFEMVARFLEMQVAVITVMMSKDIAKFKSSTSDLSFPTEEELTYAEELVKFLGPLKQITTMLCKESTPTVSLVKPLCHQLLTNILSPIEDDTDSVKEMKTILSKDLKGRDNTQVEFLSVACALDPRFKELPYLTDMDKFDVYSKITEDESKCTLIRIKQEPQDTAVGPTPPNLSELPLLPKSMVKDESSASTSHNSSGSSDEFATPAKVKRDNQPADSSLMNLLGDVFRTSCEPAKSPIEMAQQEVGRYREEKPVTLNEDPLLWWKNHADMYPTSVPSERVFSTAGDIVSHQRQNLKAKHVDMLIFLKKNLK